MTAAYDYYRIVIPPNVVPPGPDDHDRGDRVERIVDHRDHARSSRGWTRHEEWTHKREEAEPRLYSHVRRQAEQQLSVSVDPDAAPPSGRHATPTHVRREVADQQRQRWGPLASPGSLASEVDYRQHLGPHVAEAGGSRDPVNEHGKRDRTMSSGDGTRALDDGRGGRDQHRQDPTGGARDMHTYARGSHLGEHSESRGGGRKRGRR